MTQTEEAAVAGRFLGHLYAGEVLDDESTSMAYFTGLLMVNTVDGVAGTAPTPVGVR